ncbi:MAG TPA: phosphoglycerate mutase family protein [Acidimicrobiales bacterium]|nr:phosphoglycerate mutase family protein [Acidimicrobiales bacterium]
MTVILLRHASAGDRDQWEGDDRRRPLDPKGQRQAEAVVAGLDQFEVAAIISSPARRCVQTVEPLAEARDLAVVIDDALWEDRAADSIALVMSLVGTDTVISTHGDNIPSILQHLAVTEDVELGPHPDWKKASAWILEATGGRYRSAHYLPPPLV